MKPLCVIGFLGTTLDRGEGPNRWERWRPTVALCQHDHVEVARLDLLYGSAWSRLADRVIWDLKQVSPGTEVVRHVFDVPDPWDFEGVYAALHDFVDGYAFDDAFDYGVHLSTGTHVAQICWFLLTESRFIPARLIQTNNDRDDPRGSIRIIDLDLARYDRIAARFAARRQEAVGVLKSGIATKNTAFNALIDRIERVALASKAPILLEGPTGAGKTQLARRIFELRKARHIVTGPLVEVNCATLRGDQAMSALFGHVRGAFTGAATDRPGLLRAADGGMLFLDEIGELGLDEQAMLLRAVEDRRFLPVGSDREVGSDFLLVAGTNRALRERVIAGAFRDDLLARVDLWAFRLPGLAQRPEDIAPNVDFELERFAAREGRRVRFNAEARARFVTWAEKAPWPGNFRDLAAAIARMATLADGGRIDERAVAEEIVRLSADWTPPEVVLAGSRVDALLGERAVDLDRFDRVQLEDVLAVCAASRSLSEAGRALFAASRVRKTSVNDADRLRKYLARFGLDADAVGRS